METTVLNYRIIIEPDEGIGTRKSGFTAQCPTLGIADDGATIEEALVNIKSLMKFHLECLVKEGEEIPAQDLEEGLITSIKIEVPAYHAFA